MWSYFCFLWVFLIIGSPFLPAQVQFKLVKPETIKSRLNSFEGSDSTREATLRKSFSETGCSADNMSEQVVARRKEPNVICVLPGETDQVILISAHFDHISEGKGVVDNWSGASLLPSLFESLSNTKRKHTFVFVGFTAEEDGLVGSGYYVKKLSPLDLTRIRLVVNLDTLGLGPTKVWASHSDPEALGLLLATAHATQLPLGTMNVDGFGESDEESFAKKKIKTVTIHSLTPDTAGVLHSSRDNLAAIKFDDFYDTYHLLAAYLAILDTRFQAVPTTNVTATH